jgi:hypothetical protein
MRLKAIIVIGALTSLVLSFIMTIGHTLSVIQTRQQHEDEAIRCMLDQRCLQEIRSRQTRARAITPRIAS